jgi:hypothetical protein
MKGFISLVVLLLIISALTLVAVGCGGEEAEPTESPTVTPQPTVTKTPTKTPVKTVAPVSTATPSGFVFVRKIPEETLSGYAAQFVRENDQVLAASAYQSSDNITIRLPFSPHWAASNEEVKTLVEQFIRLVKTGIDKPPGVEIGTGVFEYVVEVTYQGGQLRFQAIKCAECSNISWN